MLRHDSHEFYERFGEVLRCIRSVNDQAYAAIDLGATQAKFLRVIGERRQLSQAELSRVTRTWPTLTGRTVEALLSRGWVRRKRSADDRRQYVVELTAAGKRVREQVNHARNGVIASLAKVLDEKDAEDFDRIATKILAAFPRTADIRAEE